MSFFVSTPATLSQHRPCQGWIYEAHIGGWRTRVEPTPLNFVEEVKMRLEGRKVYQILGSAEPILVERTLWHIAKSEPAIVFAEHRCSTPQIFEPAPFVEKPTMKEPRF